MKCSNTINRRPYIPLNRPEDAEKPFICRLAPFEGGFEGEWLDNFCAGEHILYFSKRGESSFEKLNLDNNTFCITGIEKDTDYEFYIESAAGRRSNIRLVRTGAVPDGATVINYLHPEDEQYTFSGKYLCSPSIVRLPDSTLMASMDVYGGKMAQNLTILFTSVDDGRSWRYLTDLYPFYWGSLFVHRGVLYILGLTTEYGNLQIACSHDNGVTWSVPSVIMYGSNVLCDNGGIHRGPMQVVPYNGRLYTTCEYGSWSKGSHLPAVISIDENDDLMTASNWSCTGFLPFEGRWSRECSPQRDTIEGSVVVTPDGEIYNCLRWSLGKGLFMKADRDDPEKSLEYVALRDMPVSNSMFRILPYMNKYILVTNRKAENALEVEGASYRNTLSVFESENLESWTFIRDIINRKDEHPKKTGFQYPCAFIEGDMLYLSVRSAYNNAQSFHNSNTMLFWKMSLEP